MEILDEKIPPRQSRSNPRVVKKPRSKFPAKKPLHSKVDVKGRQMSFTIVNTA